MDPSMSSRAHSNAVTGGREQSVPWLHSLEGGSPRAPEGRTECRWSQGSLRHWASRAGAPGGRRAELPRGALSPRPVGNGEQE